MKPLIIDNPKGATRFQRYGQRILTGLFWLILVVLLRPLLTLAAWILGGHFLTEVMAGRGGVLSFLEIPMLYVLAVFIIMGLFIGWASYNLIRFRRNERRKQFPKPVRTQDLSRFFQVDDRIVKRWQASRRIVMAHDDLGRPFDGEVNWRPSQNN